MLFNTIHYIVFFIIVVGVYYKIPHTLRLYFLLAASYVFYMWWEPGYAALILIITVVNYLAGIGIDAASSRRTRKQILAASVAITLCHLFVFKYFNFFSGALGDLLKYTGFRGGMPVIDVLLPVGISFYTFQAIGYSVDVYAGRTAPERKFHVFALYVSFFPQLVAGPIERASRLIPQFSRNVDFDYQRTRDGLALILWGLFKKMVIADRAGTLVNLVYQNPGNFSGLSALLGTYLFAFQIYCDFSGYTDIARGSAKVLGLELMVNFDMPYFADSIRDFWRRWHISLTSWFRDYIYIPLGGNRVVKLRWWYNIAVVFLLSGLWHGADWTFICWGGLHGLYIIGSDLAASAWKRKKKPDSPPRFGSLKRFLRIAVTFNLVAFAWIFFRAYSMSNAWAIIRSIADLEPVMPKIATGARTFSFTVAVSAIAFMLLIHILRRGESLTGWLTRQTMPVRWAFYLILSTAIFWFGEINEIPFIYFQF